MHLLRRFLRFFFWHFYHGFAWTYDFVAAFVSIGRWNDWVRGALPYVQGRRVLEIGHGPGHLQIGLRRPERTVIGLDESRQMGRLARNRLKRGGFNDLNLVRGVAQCLPFPSHSFDTIVSTFPAEYIFEAQTVTEIKRVLREGGRYVLVPAAWIVGRKALDRAAAWLFRATNQAPRLPADLFAERMRPQLEAAGFQTEFETVEIRSSEVLVVIAKT
jgi:ubiquinone/menaquinone biosynthesis C-methylase UbiE